MSYSETINVAVCTVAYHRTEPTEPPPYHVISSREVANELIVSIFECIENKMFHFDSFVFNKILLLIFDIVFYCVYLHTFNLKIV